MLTLATHLFIAVYIYFSKLLPPENWFQTLQVLMCAAMIAQIVNIARICNFLFQTDLNNEQMTEEFHKWNNWMKAEVAVFAGGIFANMVFLLFSSLFTVRFRLSWGNKKGEKLDYSWSSIVQSATTDYLEAQQIIGSMFTTVFVPAFLLYFIKGQAQVLGVGTSTNLAQN